MSTFIKNSRMLPFSDVPEVQDFRGKFVYNYFVPDELLNDDGAKRFQGSRKVVKSDGTSLIVDNYDNQVDPSVIPSEVPRYNELDWAPSVLRNDSSFSELFDSEDGFLQKNNNSINSEGSMNSPVDAVVRRSNLGMRQNLVGKIKLMARMLRTEAEPLNTAASVVNKFENLDDIDSKTVEDLLSKMSFADIGFVNERKVVDRTTRFLKASEYKIESAVDRRLGSMIFNPMFDATARNLELFDRFEKDNNKNFALLRNESKKENFELGVKILPGKVKISGVSEYDYQVTTAGYIVERTVPDKNGLFGKKNRRVYFVDGANTTKFIDTQIVYNGLYRYKVSAVYAIKFIVAQADDPKTSKNEAGFYRCMALVASKQSKSIVLKAQELVPPVAPDGVLYRYNYDEGTGLLINWQMPVGKQRDIKYFQVFRRRSIHEPFTCIAELDFNDTRTRKAFKKVTPPPKPEQVRSDRVYKLEFSRTFFNDARFDRRSKFIYAIATVDAHGLTSGYSAQTEVGFNREKNRLTLETISRPGAPKQYPNFFIDPSLDDNFTVDSLTTDVMLSSKKQQIKVYYDPDARIAEIDGSETSPLNKQGGEIKIVKSLNKDGAKYVFNILNVDRQKAVNHTLKIHDVRKQEI